MKEKEEGLTTKKKGKIGKRKGGREDEVEERRGRERGRNKRGPL